MKKLIAVLVLILVFAAFPMQCLAAPGAGKAYTYDHNNEAMAVPDPYETEKVLNCGDYGIESPADVIYKNGFVYVLGSGDASLAAVLDSNFNLSRKIVFTKNGEPYKTSEPRGMWVNDDGTLLVADRGKKLVFKTTSEGEVIKEYGKPDTGISGGDFLPLKVLSDRLGRIYILSEGEYRGMIRLDSEGEFQNFYGSKKVEITASVLLDTLWSNFTTDEQKERSKRHQPVEYSWITADDKGFIYTVSGSASAREDTLTKLNSSGNNVLAGSKRFGDYNLGNFMGTWYSTGFTSVCVDENGFITTLDKTWKRLFQYSEEGELLYIFGGEGSGKGTFGEAGTVAAAGDRIVVSDTLYNTLTVLKPTSFGSAVREGTSLFESGLFKESIEPWQKALSQCGNYEPAYIGIGKALHADKQYKEAMEYFKMGYSKEDYSLSFARYKAAVMRSAFAPVMTAALAVAVIVFAAVKLIRKRYGSKRLVLDSSGKISYLFYCVLHPADGFQEMRYNKKSSLLIANILMALCFFATVCDFHYRGFIFNSNSPQDFNIFSTLAVTVGLAFVFCLANWLLSTFFEGKGKLKEVWIYFCYSLVPLIASIIIGIILSQILTLEEGMFINYISVIGAGWTVISAAVALGQLHQYSFKRNIASLFCSVLGVAIVIFLIFLFANLFMQFGDFIGSVVSELLYRSEVGF